MRLKILFLTLLLMLPLVNAHSGLYHNYAGGGNGFYILLGILILSLILYEKIGDNPAGYSILWVGILAPLYVDLFFPQNDEITRGMLVGIVVIIVIVFAYNYGKKYGKKLLKVK